MVQRRAPNGYRATTRKDAERRVGRERPASWGEISNTPKKVAKLVERLAAQFGGEVLLFAYEAGPCGCGLYRQLLSLGQDCEVVAPSKIPLGPGERIKTDRQDAAKLARLLRSGELTLTSTNPGRRQQAHWAGHGRPVWRILVRAIPASSGG